MTWGQGVGAALAASAPLLGWANVASCDEPVFDCDAVCTECDVDPWTLVEAFYVYDQVAHWEVSLEDQTLDYWLQTSSDPEAGPWVDVSGGPWAAGQSTYSAPVPGGAGSCVRLLERETGGAINVAGYSWDLPSPGPAAPPPVPSLSAIVAACDSLLDARQGLGAPLNLNVAGGVAIFTPQGFLSELATYVSYWEWVGYSVATELTDGMGQQPEDKRAAIKQRIADLAAEGFQYFVLVGDANDWEQFDGPLASAFWQGAWADKRLRYLASNWVQGGQPNLDIIPTYYELDDEPPGVNQARSHPYWASDQEYADVDSDGRMDVVVARWPVSDELEVATMVYKVLSYGWLGGSGHPLSVADFVYDWSMSDPTSVRQLASTIATTLGAWDVRAFPFMGESSGTSWVWNAVYPDVVLMFGESSHRYAPAMFFSKRTLSGARFTIGALSTYRPALVIAASCAAADFATTEQVSSGVPMTGL